MKKMLILMFCLMFSNYFHGQNLVNLYKNYLADTIFVDNALKESVNSNLVELSSCHPDLIYYLLSYLNVTYQASSDNNDKVFFHKQYFDSRRFYYTQRANWIKSQYDQIQKSNIVRLKKNKAEKLFDDFSNKLSPIYELETPHDENLKEFYSYIFHTKDTSLIYSSIEDYAKLNRKILSFKLESFENMLNNFESLPKEKQIDLVLSIKKYWYLFSDLVKNMGESDIEPYIYAIRIYQNDFLNIDKFIITGSYSIGTKSLIQYDKLYQYSDLIAPEFSQPFTQNFPIKIQSISKFHVGIGYKYALKDESQFFSHITLKTLYSFNTQSIDAQYLGDSFFEYAIRNVNSREREILQYNVSNIEKMKNHSGIFESTFPVYHFIKDLFIEVGGIFGFDYISYELSFKRFEMRVEGWGDDMIINEIYNEEDRGKYNYNDFKIRFSPIVALVYSFNDLLDLRTELQNNNVGSYGRITLDLKF